LETPFIIGISGGTASCKTTLANSIVKYFNGEVALISLDYYYKDFEQPIDFLTINFDSPESLDVDLFCHHLAEIKQGKHVLLPQYDFVSHARMKQKISFLVKPVIVVEGLFLFNLTPDSHSLFDLKIYTEVEDDIRFIRRLKRDIAERGRTVESVIEQYLSTVKPMHNKYVVPNKDLSDVVFNATKDFDHAYDVLMKIIKNKISCLK
jgi:uridine kinase